MQNGTTGGKPRKPRATAPASPVRLEVYVQPRASRTELAGLHDGVIKIRVAAPAVESAANRALVRFVASLLRLAARDVRLVSGATGRRKVLEIHGPSREAVAAALGAAQ